MLKAARTALNSRSGLERMVWKNNFQVDEDLKTFEGFLDEYLGLTLFGFSDFYLLTFPLFYSKDPKDAINIGMHVDEKHFPKHFFFANFQCLRCGLCCKNYECVAVDWAQVKKWQSEGKSHILRYMRGLDLAVFPEIYPRGEIGCPMCRKVVKKPYYSCKINYAKSFVPVCKSYLCSKSVPVAHLNFSNIDELIEMIGLDGYLSLVEREWGEEFDYSSCSVKTHKMRD